MSNVTFKTSHYINVNVQSDILLALREKINKTTNIPTQGWATWSNLNADELAVNAAQSTPGKSAQTFCWEFNLGEL